MTVTRTLASTAAAVVAALAIGFVGLSQAGAMEDCPRGTLDKQYCDLDGDLVADLPPDPEKWVDPDTIIFSYTPVEDPAVYQKVWDGFINHMAEVTGKKVVFFPVQSYAAQYEAMRSGRLHIAGVNTGGNPVAVELCGLRPVRDDGLQGRVVRLRDGDHRPRRQRAIQGPGRPQGQGAGLHLADLELRLQGPVGDPQVRVRAGRRRRTSRPRSPASTTIRSSGVANKDYEAAAIANSCSKSHDRPRGDRPPTKYPHDLQVADLPDDRLRPRPQPAPGGRRQDQAGVLHLQLGRSDLQEGVQERRPQVHLDHHKHDWDVIRKIDTANGVTYDCK